MCRTIAVEMLTLSVVGNVYRTEIDGFAETDGRYVSAARCTNKRHDDDLETISEPRTAFQKDVCLGRGCGTPQTYLSRDLTHREGIINNNNTNSHRKGEDD